MAWEWPWEKNAAGEPHFWAPRTALDKAVRRDLWDSKPTNKVEAALAIVPLSASGARAVSVGAVRMGWASLFAKPAAKGVVRGTAPGALRAAAGPGIKLAGVGAAATGTVWGLGQVVDDFGNALGDGLRGLGDGAGDGASALFSKALVPILIGAVVFVVISRRPQSKGVRK